MRVVTCRSGTLGRMPSVQGVRERGEPRSPPRSSAAAGRQLGRGSTPVSRSAPWPARSGWCRRPSTATWPAGTSCSRSSSSSPTTPSAPWSRRRPRRRRGRAPAQRFLAASHTVRDWAVANPHEYTLLYGSPVPGYEAPAGHDRACFAHPTLALVGIVADAHRDGRIDAFGATRRRRAGTAAAGPGGDPRGRRRRPARRRRSWPWSPPGPSCSGSSASSCSVRPATWSTTTARSRTATVLGAMARGVGLPTHCRWTEALRQRTLAGRVLPGGRGGGSGSSRCTRWRNDRRPELEEAPEVVGVAPGLGDPPVHHAVDERRPEHLGHPGGRDAHELALLAGVRRPHHDRPPSAITSWTCHDWTNGAERREQRPQTLGTPGGGPAALPTSSSHRSPARSARPGRGHRRARGIFSGSYNCQQCKPDVARSRSRPSAALPGVVGVDITGQDQPPPAAQTGQCGPDGQPCGCPVGPLVDAVVLTSTAIGHGDCPLDRAGEVPAAVGASADVRVAWTARSWCGPAVVARADQAGRASSRWDPRRW